MPPKHLLILGGTFEARELAERLAKTLPSRVRVTTSLAGRLGRRPDVPGDVRMGGFGGVGGMVDYIADNAVDLVVDATHPFSAVISDHANAACAGAGVPRVQLLRAPWPMPPKSDWIEVDGLAGAAAVLPRFAKRVFVTTGIRGLEAFAGLDDLWFLIRVIEAPPDPLPIPNHEVITGLPPYPVEAERAILADHNIDTLVSKHAGGDATSGKILAAVEARVKIVLLRRPPPEPGDVAGTVDDALKWVESRL